MIGLSERQARAVLDLWKRVTGTMGLLPETLDLVEEAHDVLKMRKGGVPLPHDGDHSGGGPVG